VDNGSAIKEKEMQVEVIATIDVQDVTTLHDKAASGYCLRRNGDPSAFDFAQETMGAVEAPDVGACLGEVLIAALPRDAGFVLGDVRMQAAGLLRTIPMVAASTRNLTEDEIKRIDDAFGMEPRGQTHLCLEDVDHDGLWLSPKDAGFYVRLPALADRWDLVLPRLTPEMRAIVELARAQGADRIEFDRDEDPAEGLTDFFA